MVDISNIISGLSDPRLLGGGTAPKGPNVRGTKIAPFSPTLAPPVRTLGNTGRLKEILAVAGMALSGGQNTFGYQLGQYSLEQVKRNRYSNTMTKLLSGEELSAEDTRDMSPEEIQQVYQLNSQNKLTRLEEEKSRLARQDQISKTLKDLAGTLPDEAVKKFMLDTYGVTLPTGPITSQLEADVTKIEKTGQEARKTQQEAITGEKDIVALKGSIDKTIAQWGNAVQREAINERWNEFKGQYGETPEDQEKLRTFKLAIEAARTFVPIEGLSEEQAAQKMDWVFENFGLLGKSNEPVNMLDKYRPAPDVKGTKGADPVLDAKIAAAKATTKREGNPYDVNKLPVHYMLYNEGLSPSDIGAMMLKAGASPTSAPQGSALRRAGQEVGKAFQNPLMVPGPLEIGYQGAQGVTNALLEFGGGVANPNEKKAPK